MTMNMQIVKNNLIISFEKLNDHNILVSNLLYLLDTLLVLIIILTYGYERI